MEQSPSWKLIVPQRIKKFFAFCGTWRFISTFARAYFLSVSWSRSIHSTPSHPVSWRFYFNIIIPSTPRSYKWSLSFSFPHQIHFSIIPLGRRFRVGSCSVSFSGGCVFKPLPRRLDSLSFLVVSSVYVRKCRGSKRVPCLAMADPFSMFPSLSFTNFNIIFYMYVALPYGTQFWCASCCYVCIASRPSVLHTPPITS
jgi:hypothetical protein